MAPDHKDILIGIGIVGAYFVYYVAKLLITSKPKENVADSSLVTSAEMTAHADRVREDIISAIKASEDRMVSRISESDNIIYNETRSVKDHISDRVNCPKP